MTTVVLPVGSAESGEWMDDAACAGSDPLGSLFFGLVDESETEPGNAYDMAIAEVQRIAEAKAVCAQCPVRDRCRSYAISKPEAYGIWGGLTRWERARQRTRLRRQELSRT